MPWALIAALFTSVILIGTKMFDYYHNKIPNDIKFYLDIEKTMKENGHNEKDIAFIRNIAKDKIENAKNQHNERSSLEKHYPWTNRLYLFMCFSGLVLILFGGFSWIIGATFNLFDISIKADLCSMGIFYGVIGLLISLVLDFIDYKVRKKIKPEY